MIWGCPNLKNACFVFLGFLVFASSVFRRNAQPHIADMRTGGAWGCLPNKQVASVVTGCIACYNMFLSFQGKQHHNHFAILFWRYYANCFIYCPSLIFSILSFISLKNGLAPCSKYINSYFAISSSIFFARSLLSSKAQSASF